jgi:hypothetical protein
MITISGPEAQFELSLLLSFRYNQNRRTFVYPPMTKVIARIVESEAGSHIHHISET